MQGSMSNKPPVREALGHMEDLVIAVIDVEIKGGVLPNGWVDRPFR